MYLEEYGSLFIIEVSATELRLEQIAPRFFYLPATKTLSAANKGAVIDQLNKADVFSNPNRQVALHVYNNSSRLITYKLTSKDLKSRTHFQYFVFPKAIAFVKYRKLINYVHGRLWASFCNRVKSRF